MMFCPCSKGSTAICFPTIHQLLKLTQHTEQTWNSCLGCWSYCLVSQPHPGTKLPIQKQEMCLHISRFAVVFWAFQGETAEATLDVKAWLIVWAGMRFCHTLINIWERWNKQQQQRTAVWNMKVNEGRQSLDSFYITWQSYIELYRNNPMLIKQWKRLPVFTLVSILPLWGAKDPPNAANIT